MKIRKARVGFFVPTSHNGLIDDTGTPFPIMGVAEKLCRKLEAQCEVIHFGHLIEGEITGPQMANYNQSVIVDTRAKAERMADLCLEKNIDAVVLFMPTFLWQHLYVQALQRINRPVVLWGNDGIEGCQAIGLWAMRGTLDALGTIPHRDIYGSPDDSIMIKQMMDYVEAARVVQQLKRSVIGIFGTMAMGMLPGVCEDIEWLRTFGIQAEHLECQSLRREGEKFRRKDVETLHVKLSGMVRTPMPLTTDMERSLRLHLGHKMLIEKHGLDFDGVKGTFELTDHYVSPCLDLALMNATGYVTADTSEPKGALTMYMMRLFADTAHFQGDIEQVIRKDQLIKWACNGAFNLECATKGADGKYEVQLCDGPHLEGEGGAIWTNHTLKKGPITIARLQRVGNEYAMQLARGEMIETNPKDRRKLGWPMLPFGTSKLEGDVETFIREIRSQYSHLIYTDVYSQMLVLCELLKIKPLLC